MILPGLVFRPQLMAFGNLLYIVILCFPPIVHATITRGIRKYTKLITYNCESGGEIEI